MKNVVFLQENTYFNEINVFQRMSKTYEKIIEKERQNGFNNQYKINGKSTSEKGR